MPTKTACRDYNVLRPFHTERDCEKARRIANERCFHTESETNVRLLLIHACTLGGTNQQCIFPQICVSYVDLTSKLR